MDMNRTARGVPYNAPAVCIRCHIVTVLRYSVRRVHSFKMSVWAMESSVSEPSQPREIPVVGLEARMRGMSKLQNAYLGRSVDQ